MPAPPEAVLIINPTAGRGKAGRSEDAIRTLLGERGAGWQWQHTEKSGDAQRMAHAAAQAGVQRIIAVGGDGTLHEVVNGVLGTGASVGLIPFGTGNDFARGIGLHGSLERACAAVVGGVTRPMDVGVIEGEGTNGLKHFLVLSGTGFDARTAQTVNAGIRFLSGPLAYVWGAVQTLRKFSPFALTLTLDDEPARKLSCMFVSFANVETTGGGMKIAPGARPDDSCLDICLVGAVSKLTLLYQLTQVFSGSHVKHPAVTLLRARTIRVEADPPQPLLIDGEVCGTTPATVSLLPGALPFLVPAL